MSFKTFIQWLVDEKSSLCSWMQARDQVAPGAVSINIIDVRSQPEIKANYEGGAAVPYLQ